MAGRRPGPSRSLSVGVNEQSKVIQKQTDDIAEELLCELKARISKRIKDGDLEKVELPTLLGHLAKLLNAIKKPASTLQMIQLPSAPQLPTTPCTRGKTIDAGVEVNDDKLLESQEQFLNNHPEMPT